jgi:hypothetical protein
VTAGATGGGRHGYGQSAGYVEPSAAAGRGARTRRTSAERTRVARALLRLRAAGVAAMARRAAGAASASWARKRRSRALWLSA